MAEPASAGCTSKSPPQAPTEVQHLVAKVLGVPDAAVVTEVRRLGGGFGGKETQAAPIACIAAALAQRTGRPVKLRLDRDDDMVLTGKRHDFVVDYDVGFDAGGRCRRSTSASPRAAASLAGPLGRGERSGHVHCRQRLLSPQCDRSLAPLPHEHRLEHRLPGLWRTAGHDGRRARHRRDRLAPRARIHWRCASETSRRQRPQATPYGMEVGTISAESSTALELSAGYAARREAITASTHRADVLSAASR